MTTTRGPGSTHVILAGHWPTPSAGEVASGIDDETYEAR